MKEGLERAIEIIDKEIEVAIEINKQMALGMMQVREMLLKELRKCDGNG